MSYLDDKVKNLVDHLHAVKKKNPQECERIITELIDFHIINNDVEAEFWQRFLIAWKKDMD